MARLVAGCGLLPPAQTGRQAAGRRQQLPRKYLPSVLSPISFLFFIWWPRAPSPPPSRERINPNPLPRSLRMYLQGFNFSFQLVCRHSVPSLPRHGSETRQPTEPGRASTAASLFIPSVPALPACLPGLRLTHNQLASGVAAGRRRAWRGVAGRPVCFARSPRLSQAGFLKSRLSVTNEEAAANECPPGK